MRGAFQDERAAAGAAVAAAQARHPVPHAWAQGALQVTGRVKNSEEKWGEWLLTLTQLRCVVQRA